MSATLLLCALSMMVAPTVNSRSRLLEFADPRMKASFNVPWTLIAAALPLGLGALFGGISALLAVAIAVGTGLIRARRKKATLARGTELALLLAGLEILIAELRIGAHPASACSVAGEECSGAVGEVFRRGSARARLGGSAADAFRSGGSLVDRELVRVASAWTVAERYGLALAELLGAVRTDMLGRNRFRQRTEAGLAGARATATVLAGLPVLGIGLGELMGAAPLQVLFSGGAGGVMLVAGTGLVALGLLWTDKITSKVTS